MSSTINPQQTMTECQEVSDSTSSIAVQGFTAEQIQILDQAIHALN